MLYLRPWYNTQHPHTLHSTIHMYKLNRFKMAGAAECGSGKGGGGLQSARKDLHSRRSQPYRRPLQQGQDRLRESKVSSISLPLSLSLSHSFLSHKNSCPFILILSFTLITYFSFSLTSKLILFLFLFPPILITLTSRMSSALLSRFDLVSLFFPHPRLLHFPRLCWLLQVFILLDKPDEETDSILSEHVMALHSGANSSRRQKDSAAGSSWRETPQSVLQLDDGGDERTLVEDLKLTRGSDFDPIPAPLFRKYGPPLTSI